MYETPVKVSNAYYSPKLSNMQSMKTDLHSSLGFDEYTDEEEHLVTSSSDHFSSFLEDLCGPFTYEDKTHFSKLPRSSFMANTNAASQDRRRTSND